MISSLRKLFLPVAVLVAIGFVLFIVNQIAGVYLLLLAQNELLANFVLMFLIVGAIGLIVWPIFLYLRLPKAIMLPKTDAELPLYRQQLVRRFRKNKYLNSLDSPISEANLDEALTLLNREAQTVINNTATTVFLTTAISQNGKLDALTVLVAQTRMVWKIAHVYYQRPAIRDIARLYLFVATGALVASELEDMDLSMQIEPVITAYLKNSAGTSVPFVGPTAGIILDSLLQGSTNAFLTLRIGGLARNYCGSNQVISQKSIRVTAFREAGKQLTSVTLSASSQVISGIIKASKRAGVDTLKSGWESIKSSGSKVAREAGSIGQRVNPFKKKSNE